MPSYTSCFSCQPAGSSGLWASCSSARRSLPGCYEPHSQGLGTMGQELHLLPLTRVIRITTRSRSVFWKKDTTTTSRRNHKRQLLSHRTITRAFRFELCAMGGRSTQAGKAGVALSASLSGGVTHAGFLLERSRREHRPISSGSCSSLAHFLVCASLLPKEGLLALWLLAAGSHETQNIHLLLNQPWWLVMRFHTMGSVLLQHREFVQTDILDRRPDNHQATGLRREHVNLISALAHIDFRGSQGHWWSEYADAFSQERHKTSRCLFSSGKHGSQATRRLAPYSPFQHDAAPYRHRHLCGFQRVDLVLRRYGKLRT